MCFSISAARTAEEIAEAFGVFSGDIPPLPEYYHVSGFTHPDIPVLYNSDGKRKISLMKWGLVPSWVKTEEDAEKIRSKTLNVRSETADRLPSFRGSFRTGRCIVVTDGFYEPHHREGKSYPYFIKRKDSGIILLGGLYALSSVNGNDLVSFSILTVPASPSMAEIHNKKKRMPLVIPFENEFIERWLDSDLPQDNIRNMFEDSSIKNFLSSQESSFEAYTVTKDIYKSGCEDSRTVHERVVYPELTEGLLPF